MVVDDSEEGSGGSPFSKVELECGLASTSRQGLASSYEFEPPYHLPILPPLQTPTSLLSFAYHLTGIMTGGSEPLDTKHGQ